MATSYTVEHYSSSSFFFHQLAGRLRWWCISPFRFWITISRAFERWKSWTEGKVFVFMCLRNLNSPHHICFSSTLLSFYHTPTPLLPLFFSIDWRRGMRSCRKCSLKKTGARHSNLRFLPTSILYFGKKKEKNLSSSGDTYYCSL